MKRKKVLALVLLGVICGSLTGCGTTLVNNTKEYFNQVGTVLGYYMEDSSGSSEDDGTRLDAPTDVKLAEAEDTGEEQSEAAGPDMQMQAGGGWEYSFTGVENASYYQVEVYKIEDGSEESYASETVQDDGSESYTGTLNISDLGYGDYEARVYAIPATDDDEHSKSEAGVYEFQLSGEVDAPSYAYLWDYFTGTLEIQIINLEDYSSTLEPDTVEFVLENTDDSSDTITLSLEPDREGMVYSAETTEVTADATYTITASAAWDEDYVTNASAETEVGEVTVSSEDNAESEGFGYLHRDVYMNLDYPAVQNNFDVDEGGLAGIWYYFYYTDSSAPTWGGDFTMYYNATPTTTTSGSLYTYDIEVANANGSVKPWSVGGGREYENSSVPGKLEIYEDGTFKISLEYTYFDLDQMTGSAYDIAASECEGTWTDNGDGTINLSYNLDTAKTLSE
jgi:hypothetical protein